MLKNLPSSERLAVHIGHRRAITMGTRAVRGVAIVIRSRGSIDRAAAVISVVIVGPTVLAGGNRKPGADDARDSRRGNPAAMPVHPAARSGVGDRRRHRSKCQRCDRSNDGSALNQTLSGNHPTILLTTGHTAVAG